MPETDIKTKPPITSPPNSSGGASHTLPDAEQVCPSDGSPGGRRQSVSQRNRKDGRWQIEKDSTRVALNGLDFYT